MALRTNSKKNFNKENLISFSRKEMFRFISASLVHWFEFAHENSSALHIFFICDDNKKKVSQRTGEEAARDDSGSETSHFLPPPDCARRFSATTESYHI